MRFSFLSFSALALSLVKAAPNGKCPYGYDKNPPAASHGNLARDVEGPAAGKKGVFLMNRIGPINSTLYIANTDGTNARKLLGNESFFEYHASFSQDGQYITFTSERLGDGNADIWWSFRNGTGLEKLVATPSVEDAGVLSPDNSKLAYVSTANGVRTNIWVKDLETGIALNLTDTASTRGWDWSPDGHFMPAWSPDGEWIAFSSDRNTAWTGHDNGSGWEHTQELSIYAIRPNGSDFRLIAKNPGYCLGSPKWSPSGERIVYYQMTRQDTWNSHRPEDANSTVSQIFSVDFSTGLDIRQETATSTLKISPQYVTKDKVGFLVKGPTNLEGIHYASNGTSLNSTYILGSMRSPAWSPDGKEVVYEINNWTNRQMQAPLYSWDDEWDYRFTDVFPQLSPSGDQLAITQKQLGNSSVVKMNPNGSDVDLVFDTYGTGQLNSTYVVQGLAGSFQPSWSPDGKQIAVGLGFWFQERADGSAWLFNVNVANGSYEQLTFGDLNTGYPSFSHSGEEIVYRVWGSEYGLRIMNLTDKSVRVLTNGSGILNSTGDVYDNLPFYSPIGTEERIVFTRRMNYTNFDILTIRPDGTDLKVLTSSGANDAHAVWTHDGRIAYSSGSAGFRMECATYDDTFQPYGQIWIMDADGSNKKILTDSVWEDSMPLYVPNGLLD